MIGGRVLRFTRQPCLQFSRATAREHPEAVDLTQVDQVPPTRYVGLGVTTKLKSEAKAIACMAAGLNDLDVMIRQRVVVEDAGLVRRKVKQRRALAGGQNRASWHAGLSLLVISLFRTESALAKSKACKAEIRGGSTGTARRHLRQSLHL